VLDRLVDERFFIRTEANCIVKESPVICCTVKRFFFVPAFSSENGLY